MRQSFGLDTFIETGTFHGETAAWASTCFQRVVTIEGSEPLYRQAKERYADIANIEFIHGDSRDQLGKLLPRLTSPAILWLDAHWCGGETHGVTDECPVLEELKVITSSSLDHFVLVDDARLFLAPPPPPHVADQWPDIQEISQALSTASYPRHIYVFEDVILAVPTWATARIVEFLWAESEKSRKRIDLLEALLGSTKTELTQTQTTVVETQNTLTQTQHTLSQARTQLASARARLDSLEELGPFAHRVARKVHQASTQHPKFASTIKYLLPSKWIGRA